MNPPIPKIVAANRSVNIEMPHLELNQSEFAFASGIAPPPNSPASELGAVEIHDDFPPLSLDPLKIQDEKKRVLVVGISGCTSSGKSLLALILTKVFDNAIVMHQDAYFQPKCLCPLERFRAAPNDLDFIRKSLSNDNVEHHIIMSDGVDLAARQPLVTSQDADCDEAIDFLTMLGMVTTFIHTGELPDEVPAPGPPHLILGPEDNTVIEPHHDLTPYANLIAELREHVAKKIKAHASINIEHNRLGKYIQPSSSNGSTESFIDSKSDSSTTSTPASESPNDINTMLPVICFIEGFLLFSSPHGPCHDKQKMIIYLRRLNKPYDLEYHQNAIREDFQSIADLTHELHHTSPHDPFSVECQKEYEEEIWGKNIEAKYVMQEQFDMKMFLPTSKDTAKARRYEREAYIDYPAGNRHPGQMWKSEGYFEGIAWKHYEEEHRWLMVKDNELPKGGDAECAFEPGTFEGVHVRPKIDAGVEETVRWAVDAVLHKLCLEE